MILNCFIELLWGLPSDNSIIIFLCITDLLAARRDLVFPHDPVLDEWVSRWGFIYKVISLISVLEKLCLQTCYLNRFVFQFLLLFMYILFIKYIKIWNKDFRSQASRLLWARCNIVMTETAKDFGYITRLAVRVKGLWRCVNCDHPVPRGRWTGFASCNFQILLVFWSHCSTVGVELMEV